MPTRRQTWRHGPRPLGVGAAAGDRLSTPSMVTEPAWNASSPFRQRRNVLLPLPEGPMIAATSPRATERLTPREDLDRAVPLDQLAHLDHVHADAMPAPPLQPPPASRRSDHRENQDSGTLISM